MSRRTLLAGASGLLAAPAIVRAQGANGVALVIGNSKYQWEDSLPNVRRDAPDIAKVFQAMGLKTELHENLGRDALRQTLNRFGASARGAAFAAVYFAGHGAFADKATYLVPVDADLNDPSSVKNLFGANTVARAVKDAGHTLLVFDSCRNNPSDGWPQQVAVDMSSIVPDSTSPGSSAETIRTFPNSLRLFSTAPGRVALDGPAGQNSPFAAALMQQLESASIDLQALPGRLRRNLLLATQGRQFLWDQNPNVRPLVIPGASSVVGTSGPRVDASKIVELDKAYAFAQQHGIPLPPGLVAVRPSNGDSRKIGSYASELGAGGATHPVVILILSTDESGTGAGVMASSNPPPYWRLVDAVTVGDGLQFKKRNREAQYTFKWHDANSGEMALAGSGKGRTPVIHRFTRLDG